MRRIMLFVLLASFCLSLSCQTFAKPLKHRTAQAKVRHASKSHSRRSIRGASRHHAAMSRELVIMSSRARRLGPRGSGVLTRSQALSLVPPPAVQPNYTSPTTGNCPHGGKHITGDVDRNGRTHCDKCGQFM